MQAIGRISTATAVRLRQARQQPAQASFDETMEAESRAVVPLAPIQSSEFSRATRRYPLASFLAHLIAVRERAPQTRRRGRAAPRDATSAYAATQTPPSRTTDHLRKSA
jgi:hypothetical protein